MKKGDLVTPTYNHKGGKVHGIVLEAKAFSPHNSFYGQIKVAIVFASNTEEVEMHKPQWYHCTHWVEVKSQKEK